MTTPSTSSPARIRTARLALAGAALLAAVTGASADDGGIGGFLRSVFGGQPQQAAPAPQPARGYAPAYTREDAPSHGRYRRASVRMHPLVVRLHPSKPRIVVAQAPTRPGKVSIFEDRTLRRGDAVMMAQGVRIFAGSSSWPYTARDFVALTQAKNLDHDTSKVLAQLDKLPRG